MKFRMTPTVHSEKVITARLGGNASNTRFTDADVGKFVKLTADSNYVLVGAANPIEGVVTSVETGIYDGYVLGGVVTKGYVDATAGGSQAAGTGALAVGDWVLAAAPAAVQVAETTTPCKVVKATDQAAAKADVFKARVVSLGDVGTGAVGTTIVIELL